MNSIDICLQGKALYGDDFSLDQIAEWYADEEEGYADLGAMDAASYRYGYHAWNMLHAYRHLPKVSFEHVLGFGSAYGEELLPIISQIKALTIVDPSKSFVREDVHGVPATYLKPALDGRLPLPAGSVDLITCFGVLHHIPNVSFVVSELVRTLKVGGHMLLREPIVSMGDWRLPRRGLTKRERGIPLHILEQIALADGMRIESQSLCGFSLTPRLFRALRTDVYNSPTATWLDAVFSKAFSWNLHYHPRSLFQRIRPTSVFLVLSKPALVVKPQFSEEASQD